MPTLANVKENYARAMIAVRGLELIPVEVDSAVIDGPENGSPILAPTVRYVEQTNLETGFGPIFTAEVSCVDADGKPTGDLMTAILIPSIDGVRLRSGGQDAILIDLREFGE